MRLRPPPVVEDSKLTSYLQHVYSQMIFVTMPLGMWSQENVTASQTDVDLNLTGSTTNTFITMPYNGNVVGISIHSNEARTAGTLTVKPTINGTESTVLSAILNATDTTKSSSVSGHESDPFLKNDHVGVSITTDGTWAPTTADVVVSLFIKPGFSE